MNTEVYIVGRLLAVAIGLFVTEWIRADLVAPMVMLASTATGILAGEDATMGFSNEAVTAIGSTLIRSGSPDRHALFNTTTTSP